MLEQYKSDGLNRMGPIKPALALSVFSVFVLVYFSLWKGVKSTGKVCKLIKYSLTNLMILNNNLRSKYIQINMSEN